MFCGPEVSLYTSGVVCFHWIVGIQSEWPFKGSRYTERLQARYRKKIDLLHSNGPIYKKTTSKIKVPRHRHRRLV